MRVVVFGAAGWLGRAVLANLQDPFRGTHAVRAFDRGPEAWRAWEDVDGAWTGEIISGDISRWGSVHAATEGMDAVIHISVYFGEDPEDPLPWLINLKGLWNTLESARQRGIRRVVHIGSCETVHPDGLFFDANTPRPGGGIYVTTKRLQEELCRSYWTAHRVPTIVLRPDYIVDSRIGLGRFREKLGPPDHPTRNGWVCRHDLAQACRLAIERKSAVLDIFHIVGTPEADLTCNVARSREVLGLKYEGNLEQYRAR